MGLALQAKLDVAAILGDTSGFAVSATLTSPSGSSSVILGMFSLVTQTQDPNTGVVINGSRASFVVSDAILTAAGIGKPEGEADLSRKPWYLDVADASGTSRRFKVYENTPDRTVGCHILLLEFYRKP